MLAERVSASASFRTCAMKLEAPEIFCLEIQTACDVAELYLDVKRILKRHQGIRESLGLPQCCDGRDHMQSAPLSQAALSRCCGAGYIQQSCLTFPVLCSMLSLCCHKYSPKLDKVPSHTHLGS